MRAIAYGMLSRALKTKTNKTVIKQETGNQSVERTHIKNTQCKNSTEKKKPQVI